MRKKIYFVATVVVAVASTGVGIASSDSPAVSSLETENVEALSQNEWDISKCANGCSTENHGQFCCRVAGFTLYYR